jgi:hypothetical protein
MKIAFDHNLEDEIYKNMQNIFLKIKIKINPKKFELRIVVCIQLLIMDQQYCAVIAVYQE